MQLITILSSLLAVVAPLAGALATPAKVPTYRCPQGTEGPLCCTGNLIVAGTTEDGCTTSMLSVMNPGLKFLTSGSPND